jgi:phage repressor protein C with HTH and peptisase S24 domain
MLSHEGIWRGIDTLAKRLNLSPSGLARLAGLDPTSFNLSKRLTEDRPRWPSTESLSKVLEATGTDFIDFATLTKHGGAHRPVRLIGLAKAGLDGMFDDSGFPTGDGWEEIDLPDTTEIYAIEITGDSMLPLYREGDRVLAHPVTDARRGDRVIIRLNNGEVLAKEISRLTSRFIQLRSINPDYEDRIVPREDITWISRIVWASQ